MKEQKKMSKRLCPDAWLTHGISRKQDWSYKKGNRTKGVTLVEPGDKEAAAEFMRKRREAEQWT